MLLLRYNLFSSTIKVGGTWDSGCERFPDCSGDNCSSARAWVAISQPISECSRVPIVCCKSVVPRAEEGCSGFLAILVDLGHLKKKKLSFLATQRAFTFIFACFGFVSHVYAFPPLNHGTFFYLVIQTLPNEASSRLPVQWSITQPLYGPREMEFGIWMSCPSSSLCRQTLNFSTPYHRLNLSTSLIGGCNTSQYLFRYNSMCWSGILPVQKIYHECCHFNLKR